MPTYLKYVLDKLLIDNEPEVLITPLQKELLFQYLDENLPECQKDNKNSGFINQKDLTKHQMEKLRGIRDFLDL